MSGSGKREVWVVEWTSCGGGRVKCMAPSNYKPDADKYAANVDTSCGCKVRVVRYVPAPTKPPAKRRGRK